MARILIIDDDESFGELLKRRLERRNEITLRSSPFGSLNEIKKGAYDLVILDIRMPALDGINLLRLIRETKGIWSTKVLLCSSIDVDELQEIAQNLMVDGYISKSAPGAEILGKVAEVLGPWDGGPESRRTTEPPPPSRRST